jgi:DNA-binding response OmpR family regulator
MRQRVLIIDDDEDTIALLSKGLAKAGYEVRGAKDIVSGFDEAQHFAPSVLIVDLFPGGNALGLLKQMKESHDLQRVPVIVLSALGDADSKEMVHQCGAAAYLSKPIRVQDVVAEIRHQLNPGAHANYII